MNIHNIPGPTFILQCPERRYDSLLGRFFVHKSTYIGEASVGKETDNQRHIAVTVNVAPLAALILPYAYDKRPAFGATRGQDS